MTNNTADSWLGWMFLPLRRYAVFRGRSGRQEFWWFCLFLVLGYLTIFCSCVAALMVSGDDEMSEGLVWTMISAWGLLFAVTFVPGFALTTRRFHDMGLSGATLIVVLAALAILNVLGWIGYLVWMSLPPQRSENRHGPPLGQQDVAAVFA